jgi:hypothetical protein
MKKIFVVISILVFVLMISACANNDKPFDVTFDGEECTYTGPTELSMGVQKFAYKNISDREDVDLWAYRLLDGKAFQDLLDLQSEPGEYFPKVSWIVHPRKSGEGDESNGGIVFTLDLDIEGEYILLAGSYGPENIWICYPPIQAIEAPSE